MLTFYLQNILPGDDVRSTHDAQRVCAASSYFRLLMPAVGLSHQISNNPVAERILQDPASTARS